MTVISGSAQGGTRVQLTGNGMFELGSDYVCDFNGTRVRATLAASSVTEYVDFTRTEDAVLPVYLPNVFRQPGERAAD